MEGDRDDESKNYGMETNVESIANEGQYQQIIGVGGRGEYLYQFKLVRNSDIHTFLKCGEVSRIWNNFIKWIEVAWVASNSI